jgi:uncharacterized damage-inducible protein DinB
MWWAGSSLRIFVGTEHGFSSDNTTDTPEPEDLRAAVAASDRWYLEYLEAVPPELLSESVPFTFTDGDEGCMSREEMLTHVVIHGGYHRGEVGRLLTQLSVSPPWDTFAVYLHGTEPSRRIPAHLANLSRQAGRAPGKGSAVAS